MTSIRTVLAFDYGTRRIGVAVGQDLTGTATPLTTLAVRDGRLDWRAIARLVEEWQPDLFVVGLPYGAHGARSALVAASERFGRRLGGRYGRPVAYVDERLSSHAAALEPGARRDGLDAVAARLLLETWLAEQARA